MDSLLALNNVRPDAFSRPGLGEGGEQVVRVTRHQLLIQNFLHVLEHEGVDPAVEAHAFQVGGMVAPGLELQ